MPFPKPPCLDLHQWDDWACEAAIVAQILYMGNKLRYPFDTARLDQRLGRQPEMPIVSAQGLRLIARLLPVRIHIYSPISLRDPFDRQKVAKALRRQGYSDKEIEAHFKGPMFELAQTATRDLIKLGRELGPRYKRRVCTNSSRYLSDYLRRGALVVASQMFVSEGAPATHNVLLIPRTVRHGEIHLTVFNPDRAQRHENFTFDQLIALGEVQLDECGFTAYML